MPRVTALALLALALALAQCSRADESPADAPVDAPPELFSIERIQAPRRLLPVQSAGVDPRGCPQYLLDATSDAVFSLNLEEPSAVEFVHDPFLVAGGSGSDEWVEFRQRPNACGDLDGDGRMDLAYASAGSREVVVLLGTDHGLRTGGAIPCVGRIASIDIGSLDEEGGEQTLIVAYDAGGPAVRFYRWEDADGLVESSRGALWRADKPRDVAVLDANLDGLPDLVWLDARNETLVLYAQHPSGEFVLVPDFFDGELGAYVAESCVADIDGDGTDDLVALSMLAPVSVVLSSSPGRVQDWSAGVGPAEYGEDVEAVVLDASGTYEIVWPLTDSGSLARLAGVAPGEPTYSEVRGVCASPWAIAVIWPRGDGPPGYLVAGGGEEPELVILRRR